LRVLDEDRLAELRHINSIHPHPEASRSDGTRRIAPVTHQSFESRLSVFPNAKPPQDEGWIMLSCYSNLPCIPAKAGTQFPRWRCK